MPGLKSNYSKIDCRHSSFIRSIFPKIERFGTDLGNIEVKETYSNNGMFTLRKKDKESDYILFYTHVEDTFFLVKSKELTFLSEKSGMRLSGVKKHSFFQSNDVIKMLENVCPLLKDEKYNPLKE